MFFMFADAYYIMSLVYFKVREIAIMYLINYCFSRLQFICNRITKSFPFLSMSLFCILLNPVSSQNTFYKKKWMDYYMA